jgi:hypothetical protein
MGARVLAAISHASFLGIAAIVAAASVPPERSARAVSLVWLGFSAASLVGVPGATAIGHMLGWRAAFWALAMVGIMAGVALQLWMPSAPRRGASSLSQEIVALRRPQVLLAMVMSLLVCASTFAVFTYVAPLLLNVTHISVEALPFMLLLFGVGGAAGMVVGGRLGDWKPLKSVALLSIAYAIFYPVLMMVVESVALVGAAMIFWGFLFLAPCVPLHLRLRPSAAGRGQANCKMETAQGARSQSRSGRPGAHRRPTGGVGEGQESGASTSRRLAKDRRQNAAVPANVSMRRTTCEAVSSLALSIRSAESLRRAWRLRLIVNGPQPILPHVDRRHRHPGWSIIGIRCR